jgi:hypothetical protein
MFEYPQTLQMEIELDMVSLEVFGVALPCSQVGGRETVEFYAARWR